MDEVYQRIRELSNTGEPFCLVQVVESKGAVPRGAGAVMVVDRKGDVAGSIGGGRLEEEMRRRALEALHSGEVRVFRSELDELDMHCGGRLTVVVQPIGVVRRAVVFGGGNVGREVAFLLHYVGFEVRVVDPSPVELEGVEWVGAQHFDVQREVGERDVVVIATATHDTDEHYLDLVLSARPWYVGMVASPKKRDLIFERLIEKGHSPDELKRVHSPVGLDIGAQTPREIAVSVVSEVIKLMRGKGE